ncbi:MAG: MEDS domain-containing protein [Candidatus Geothermarchaeales archaeon]
MLPWLTYVSSQSLSRGHIDTRKGDRAARARHVCIQKLGREAPDPVHVPEERSRTRERVFNIASEKTSQQVRDATKKFSLDIGILEAKTSMVILDFDQFYLFDGEPDIRRTIWLLNQAHREAEADSFKGVRAAGEMACWLQHGYVDQPVEYEKPLEAIREWILEQDLKEAQLKRLQAEVVQLPAVYARRLEPRSSTGSTSARTAAASTPGARRPCGDRREGTRNQPASIQLWNRRQTMGVRSSLGTPLETPMSKPWIAV